MTYLCVVGMMLLGIADEKSTSPTELVRQAIAAKQKIPTWVYSQGPPEMIGNIRISQPTHWSRPEKLLAGDLFLLDGHRDAPSFKVSQILDNRKFLDLDHGFLIEGLDTREMSDGQPIFDSREGQPLSMFVGVVVGPHQYNTVGGGRKTVTHVRLSLHPDFVISDSEAKEGFRLWRSTNGQIVVAKFVSKRGSQVRLVTRQKKQFSVKVSELSKEDAAFLESK